MALTQTLFAIAVAALAIGSANAQELIVFGDSLSDSGPRSVGGGFSKWLDETLRLDTVFPAPPYAPGRYSNGPVWVEYASQALGIEFVNWAAGGATTGAGLSQAGELPAGFAGIAKPVRVLSPNLAQQLDQHYLWTNNTANPDDVYVVFIGNNDYFSIWHDGWNVTAEEVVGYIEDAIDDLYDHGARKFILVGIPPVAAIPTAAMQFPNLVEAWQAHDELLKEVIRDFSTENSDSTVEFFDLSALVLKAVGNAEQLGFKYFTSSDACFHPASAAASGNTQPCSDPDQRLFWDTEHPTTAAHKIIGQAFAQQFATFWTNSPAPAPAAASA